MIFVRVIFVLQLLIGLMAYGVGIMHSNVLDMCVGSVALTLAAILKTAIDNS